MSYCTQYNCYCELFEEIGICLNYGTKNIKEIYEYALKDSDFKEKLKEINKKANNKFKNNTNLTPIKIPDDNKQVIRQLTPYPSPILYISPVSELIVDEIDRLNPLKCPEHRPLVTGDDGYVFNDYYKNNNKCIGCRIGKQFNK